MRGSLVAAFLLGSLLLAARAEADDAREASRSAFRRGVAEARDEHYGAARDAFFEAYRLYPHPSILLNLGIARTHVGEWVEAEEDLVRFLSDDGGAPEAEIASGRAALAEARRHLGTLRLRVTPPSARAVLDDRPLALLPGGITEVRAAAGDRFLRVSAESFEPALRRIHVEAGSSASVDVALAPMTDRRATGDASTGTDARAAVGWTLVGAAVVGAGIGAYAGARALGLAEDYDTPGHARYQDPAARSAGITLRTAADIAFGAALVAGGVGAYLLLVSADHDGAPSAALRVGPWFTGVAGRF